MYEVKKNSKYIWCMFFAISMISGIIVLGINNATSYQWLFLLPFTYGISTFVFSKIFGSILYSKVSLILILGYFIKMVVSPLLFALGGYISFFYGYASTDNVNLAVIYMIYEYFFVFSIAQVSLRNRKLTYRSFIETQEYAGSKRVLGWVLLICIFIIFAYNYVPEIKKIYYFITDYQVANLVGIRWDNETIVARGSIQRYVYSLFMFLWPLVRFLLPTVLIHLNYTKRGNTRQSVILSSLTIFIPFVLLGGDNLAPFIAALFALIVIVKLYGVVGKKIAKMFLIIGIFVMTGMVIGKLTALSEWRGATGITNLAQMLNSYVPGFDNIAIAFNMSGTEKAATLFSGIVSGIPFIGSFIKVSHETLNDIFVEIANTGGQIVPWGSGLGYYFGYIISPIITGSFIWFLLYREERSNTTSDFWTYYSNMIFSTYTAFSIIIYSTQIYNRFLWNVMLPIMLILMISRAKNRRKLHYD